MRLTHFRRQEATLESLLADEANPAPAILLLEDCNASGRAPHTDGLIARLAAECAPARPTRLLLTARDEGTPLPTELLDAAFLIRLEPEAADTPWHDDKEPPAKMEFAVSREALAHIFRPHPEAVSEEAADRMARLRAALGERGVRLSRRTLDAVWNFCAAAAPLLRDHSPLQALDIALARRALPAVLSAAPLEALKALPEMVADLEECRKLLESPLPIF